MKKLKLIKRLLSYSHEKQSPQRFARYAAMLIMLLTLGVGQMWGADPTYYYRGNQNSWDESVMSISADGFYEYFSAKGYSNNGNQNNNFKVSLGGDTWSYNNGYCTRGFNGTNISGTSGNGSIGLDWDGDNICVYNTSDFYILVYYPNTCINTTSNPIICASTTKPQEKFYVAGDNSWMAKDWITTDDDNLMSRDGNIYSKTISSVSAGTNTHKLKVSTYNWKNSWGYSDYSAATHPNIVGSVTEDDGNIVFKPAMEGDVTVSFNTSTKKVSIVCQAPEITLKDNGGSGGSGTQNTYYGEATSSVTVPTKTGYNFLGYWSDDDTPVQVIDENGDWIKNISGYTNNESTAEWVVREDHEFTAHWEAKTYTVTLKPNGPTASDKTITATYLSSTHTSLTNFTYSGYNLLGYYTTSSDSPTTGYKVINADGTYVASAPNSTGTITNSSSQWIYDGAKTLYARWEEVSKCSVTYNSNGADDGDVPTDATLYEPGSNVTVKGNTGSLTRTGYTFAGWTDNDSGTGSVYGPSWTTTYSSIAANVVFYAKWTETPYTITIVGGTAGSTTAKVVTTGSATANPPFGKYFINWTVPNSNFSFAGGTDADDATITFNATADGTVTANFGQLYAFIQGRMTIYNAARDSKTHVASSEGGWDEGSTRVPMNYDGTNHEFYLSTHMTPAELATEQSSLEQYFFVKTSSDDDNLTDVNIYRPAKGAEDASKKLTAAGTKLSVSKDDGSTHSYWFDSSDDTGYAKLYFNGTQIWYSLEQTLQYDGNGNTGGSAPASKTYYDKGATAKAASNGYTKSGYTFNGWKTGASTGTSYAVNADVTMNSNITLYAQWTENDYVVTVQSSDATKGGTVADDEINGHKDTKVTLPKATAKAGYYFVNWTVTSGTATIDNSTSADEAEVYGMTGNVTVQANFAPKWSLVGGDAANTDPDDALGNWGTTTNKFTSAYTEVSSDWVGEQELTLAANTEYELKMYDLESEPHWYGTDKDADKVEVYYANGGDENDLSDTDGSAKNLHLFSAAGGTYTFSWNETDKKLAIEYPTSWWITTGVNDEDGGSFTAVDNASNNVYGGKFVANNATVTFTASNETGYTFDGWYNDDDYADGHKYADNGEDIDISGDDDKVLTLSSITAGKSVYAKFSEKMTTVALTNNGHGHVEIGGATVTSTTAGVTTTKTITAVPDAGYYFSGWEIVEGSDFSVAGTGEANATTTLTGGGSGETSGQTLKANFAELDKIYFRNLETMDDGAWTNVYVYFGVTWSGEKGVQTLSTYANMTQIGTSDIYWAYVPRSFTTSAGTAVAFSNADMHTWDDFYGNKGAYRTDYNKALNMFVPYHKSSGTTNKTDYYSDGYWKNYPIKAATSAGYYLQTTRGTDAATFKGQADNSDIIECTVRVDEDNRDKTFHIVSAGGKYFEPYDYSTSTYPKITSTASTMTMKGDDTDGLTVTLTSQGDYTFVIDQSGDVMVLTVNYPISVGDYRIKHSYLGRNKANSADSTYYTYSDVIKSHDATSTNRVSMYLNDGGTETLVLQKCTSTSGSSPTWSAGDETKLSDVLDKLATDKNGVYQFDVTINTSTDKVSTVANIKLYDGPFYIKTDCAPGGWGSYTQNAMDKNTANSTAFDYYLMHWFDLDTEKSETANIKCVIANKYNNAISDTLKSDGIATMSGTEPVLDNDASVRFSYNSKTNKLERAYLTGASSLTLESSVQYKIYDYSDGTTDQYGLHPGFVDDVVWTYEITVKAKLGAQAGVRANWANKAGTDHYQTLIANTNKIIDGTGSGMYTIRILFDFKTNSITSTWEPTDEGIEDALTDVDVMLVREGQEASDVITFNGGSLAPRKLVGSLKFEKVDYWGKVGSWNSDTYPLLTFFVSFPFDVKVSDIFGLNSAYGDAYVVRRYAGDERAAKGFFKGDGTTTFWKDLTIDDTMNAYEGYIVVLDNDYFNNDTYSLWGEKTELYLYFPSSKGGTISSGSKTIPVPSHPCTIDMTFDGTKNHMNTDSHWNLIGVPVFTTNDDGGSPEEGTPGAIFAETEGDPDAFNYFFEWSSTGNDFSISTAKNYEFKAMHGYMVQYTGPVKFIGSVFVPTPASVAARHTAEKKNYDIELQVLNSDSEMINRTYVALLEGASSEFVLNEDVYLSPNNRAAEIYTFAGDYDVAANRLPIESQSVQVGLNVHKAGTYSITMPSGFSGTATLIDTYNNTRTNLAIEDYEVNLTKGACNDRFLLEININNAPTAIDGTGDGSLKDGKAHKFIENGVMYILQNGRIYNAEGALVK